MKGVPALADRHEAELRHAGIRVDHDAVAALQFAPQIVGEFEPQAHRARARVLGFEMRNARIGREEFSRFAAADQHNCGIRETPFHRVQNDAGDFDVRSERDARKHVNVVYSLGDGRVHVLRLHDPGAHQFLVCDCLRGVERVGQRFDHDAKEFAPGTPRRARGPAVREGSRRAAPLRARLWRVRYTKYLPTIGSSFSMVVSGTTFRSVISACCSAEPHLQLASGRHGLYRFGDHAAGVGGVLLQHANDVRHLDRIMLGMPAVVIRHHGDGHVTDFRFARQLRFLQIRHADDVHAP